MKLSRRGLLTGVAAVALGHRVPVAASSFTTADVVEAVELLWNNNMPTLDGGYYYLSTHVEGWRFVGLNE